MKVVRLSALRTGRLYPQLIFLVLISVKRLSQPQEGLYQLKIPMTPPGIEPAIFLLVAHCLNQLRHHISQQKWVPGVFPGGVQVAVAYGRQTYHLYVPIILKSGSFNRLEPSGPVPNLISRHTWHPLRTTAVVRWYETNLNAGGSVMLGNVKRN